MIDFSGNQISELPRALPYFLAELNFLNVENNSIGQIPHIIGLHNKLKNLQIGGNPQKTVRLAVLDKGFDAIMSYLANKFNESVDS